MSKVGELSVVITANTKGVERGVAKTSTALKKQAKELRSAANRWAKWGAAAAAAAATAAAAIVKSQLNSIKEIKFLADTANTSVATFQQQAFAAEEVGISMEKYGDILKDVTERVGEFASIGSGPMIDFFENVAPKVGVTADSFRDLSGADALQLYVDSLEKANLSQQKMTFYMETMASDSTRLLPLLKDNGKAMKEAAKRAKELGVGLSDMDVVSAIAAQKALKDASVGMDAAMKNATIALAPYIAEISKQFNMGTQSVDDFAGMIENAFSFAAKTVGIFGDGIRGIKAIFKGLQWAAATVAKNIGILFDRLTGSTLQQFGRSVIDFLIMPFKEFLEVVAEGGKFFGAEMAAIDGFLKDLDSSLDETFGKPRENFSDTTQALIDQAAEIKQEFNDLASAPMPSEVIGQWVAETSRAVAKARADAEVVAAEQFKEKRDNKDSSENIAESEEAKRIRLENEKILEALLEGYLAEETTMQEHFDRELAIVDAAETNKTLSAERAAALRSKIAEDERKFHISTTTSAMGAIVEALNTGGKKSQAIAKKIAIAKAIISGGQAAVDAWKAGMATGGPWAPAVAAAYTAASLARTGSMIASINSNSTPGKPGGSMPSTPTPSSSSSGDSGGGNGVSKNISISLAGGSMFSPEAVRELIGEINNQVGDGVSLNIAGGS